MIDPTQNLFLTGNWKVTTVVILVPARYNKHDNWLLFQQNRNEWTDECVLLRERCPVPGQPADLRRAPQSGRTPGTDRSLLMLSSPRPRLPKAFVSTPRHLWIPYVIVLKHQTIHTTVLNRTHVIWQSKLQRTPVSRGQGRDSCHLCVRVITQWFRQLRTLCCYIYLSEKSWGVTRCCQTDINVVYKGQQLN